MINQSPKAKFLESNDNISAHRKMVDTREFQRAIDYAQMEYSRLIAEQVKDGNTSMYVGFKLQGMLEFVQTLKLLSEAPQASARIVTPTLNHSV
jgi:hypothetical protein